MGTPMDGWRRLARHVTNRRLALGLTQEDVRAKGGPSTATMRLIEGALQTSYSPRTLAALERVLGWQHGSAEAVLAGEEPSTVPTADDLYQQLDRTRDPQERRAILAELGRRLVPMPEGQNAGGETYHHPELGPISHPEDIEIWELQTLDEAWKVAAIKTRRKDRLWDEAHQRRRAA